MATKEQIKKTILQVAGDPVSGIISDLAEAWAEAIVALDAPQTAASAPAATKETRITKPEEVR
jgi:hypothetical protein